MGISLGFLFYYFIARGFHWGAYHSISLLLDISLGSLSESFIAGGYHWDAYSSISIEVVFKQK